MLNVGDLVTTLPIHNHGGNCFRLFQFSDYLGGPVPVQWKNMVDKLYHEEVGILLDIDGKGMGLVLSPRAKTGWINIANLQEATRK